MRAQSKRFNIIKYFFLGFLIGLSGCSGVSETITDPDAGVNGSFEITKDGLPVNWTMYTPNTVPIGEFEILLDKDIVKEGNQSLRFNVRKCAERGGGFFSPGFTNQFNEFVENAGSGSYKISYWVRNDSSRFMIKIGSVGGKGGGPETIIDKAQQIDEWQFFESEVHVPEGQTPRMELSILAPGTFWIDDVRIQKMSEL